MASRRAQPMDIHAIRYIKDRTAELERDRSWLAAKSGISYQTVRGWWDSENVAISLGDLDRMFRALQIDPGVAMKEIRRRVVAAENSDG